MRWNVIGYVGKNVVLERLSFQNFIVSSLP